MRVLAGATAHMARWGRCCTSIYKAGSGTFRSSVFSLLGAKVPTENFRSRERELSFPSKQVRFLTTVIDIYNTQMQML